MKIETELNDVDRMLLAEATDGFVPAKVSDIHAHVVEPTGYAPTTLGAHLDGRTISPVDYRTAMELILPRDHLTEALFFPFPAREHDRATINAWMYAENAKVTGSFRARGLAIVGPRDDPRLASEAMADGRCVGLKPYHLYAGGTNTPQAALEDFTPEWMWRLCDQHGAILMIHLVRDEAVSDPGNREAVRRLAEKYPRCQVVLAHIARSFNHRTARGLRAIADLPNIWVDTSAIAEAEAIRAAIDLLGPQKVLFGTDYPISHVRGRCVTTGNQFLWVYPEDNKPTGMTLVGIESLLAIRAACEQAGLKRKDVEGIFHGNAQEVLQRFSRGAKT